MASQHRAASNFVITFFKLNDPYPGTIFQNNLNDICDFNTEIVRVEGARVGVI